MGDTGRDCKTVTVASLREESGRVIARTVLPTEGPARLECVEGTRGAIHVVFDEGTQAQCSPSCAPRWKPGGMPLWEAGARSLERTRLIAT